MIHRALLGSLERFIGILIEHYGGAFPFWLAPVQVRIIPVGEDHRGAAEEIAKALREAGFRVDVDDRDETVGKRIRDGELEKIPKLIVYGDRESAESLSVRDRGGEQYQTRSWSTCPRACYSESPDQSRSGPVPHPASHELRAGSTETIFGRNGPLRAAAFAI